MREFKQTIERAVVAATSKSGPPPAPSRSEQPGREFNPERLRRFEVEGQLDSYGRLDRQIGWFLALVWGPQSQALSPTHSPLPSYQF
jgi:hypothetical protein